MYKIYNCRCLPVKAVRGAKNKISEINFFVIIRKTNYCLSCSLQVESNICVDVADVSNGNIRSPTMLGKQWEAGFAEPWFIQSWYGKLEALTGGVAVVEKSTFSWSKNGCQVYTLQVLGLNLHLADEVSVCTILRVARCRVLSICSRFSSHKNKFDTGSLQIMPSNHVAKMMVVEGANEIANPAEK